MRNFEYTVIRSDRRTLGLQIRPDGTVIVRAPRFASVASVRRFVDEHADWVEKHLKKINAASDGNSFGSGKLTEEELKALAERAKQTIPQRVAYYASIIGVSYGRITIRNQTTRWGSCSSAGNLNFNCLLMLTPDEVIDSVVVHELCHRKYMNHSADFYNEVLKAFPDYKIWNRWLKENGAALMAKNCGN